MADRSTAALGRKPPMSGLGPAPDTRSARGYLAKSDQGRHLSSLKSTSRLAKRLDRRRGRHSLHRHHWSLLELARSDFITPV